MAKLALLGDKEIQAVLKELPQALADKAIGTANMNAAKPLVEKEKQLAPDDTGALVDSIGAYRAPKKAQRLGLVVAGAQRRGKYKGFHAHLVEFGTRERKRGRMPKQPFAKPAFDATQTKVQGLIHTELSKIVQRVMKKHLKSTPGK